MVRGFPSSFDCWLRWDQEVGVGFPSFLLPPFVGLPSWSLIHCGLSQSFGLVWLRVWLPSLPFWLPMGIISRWDQEVGVGFPSFLLTPFLPGWSRLTSWLIGHHFGQSAPVVSCPFLSRSGSLPNWLDEPQGMLHSFGQSVSLSPDAKDYAYPWWDRAPLRYVFSHLWSLIGDRCFSVYQKLRFNTCFWHPV